MLTIRRDQIRVFEQAAMSRFEDEMVVHSKGFSHRLCKVIGDEQVHVAIRRAIKRSGDYGFTNRGPIRLFIELMFLFGSAFDTDPQYPWAAKTLNESVDQMLRAERLRDKALDYQEKVSGPDLANTRNVLRDLFTWANKRATFSPTELVEGMVREMAHLSPRKVAYIGEEGLTELILEGCDEAMRCQLSTVRGEALIGALMFAFGHGCIDDPLYPWISRTLKDERIIDPAARAERLEMETITFMEHAIATPPREGDKT